MVTLHLRRDPEHCQQYGKPQIGQCGILEKQRHGNMAALHGALTWVHRLLAIWPDELPKIEIASNTALQRTGNAVFRQKGNTARRHCGSLAILHSGVRLVLLRAGNQATRIAARS